MNRTTHLLFAASFIGGISYLSPALNAEDVKVDASINANAPASPDSNKVELPPGFQTKDLKEAKDIKGELATLTEDALKKDHFDNLINNFVDQDRNRMKDFKNIKVDDLNTQIDKIRQAWKTKYQKDFDIDRGDRDAVYNDQVKIVQGEVTDTDLAVKNWPVPASAEMAAKPDSAQGHAEQAAAHKTFGGDVNLDKGRNVALVKIPSSHNMSGVTLSLIHELPDQWRVDVPNTIDGQQIHDNLLKRLTYISDHLDKLPDDINDGYRMLTHSVASAVLNVEPSMKGDRAGDRSLDADVKVKTP